MRLPLLALLLGLGLNYLFGFWQADPSRGIVIVIFLLHEGYEVWEEAGEEEDEEETVEKEMNPTHPR